MTKKYFSPSLSFLIVINLLLSCRSVKIIEPNNDFLSLIRSNRVMSSDKLQFQGIYGSLEKTFLKSNSNIAQGDSLYVYSNELIIFFKNGLIAFNDWVSVDSLKLRESLKERNTKKVDIAPWGVYTIVRDTIKAIIYVDYPKDGIQTSVRVYNYFEGIIKDENTILNWHLVPPYPSEKLRYDRWILGSYKKKRDLYFKPFPVQELLGTRNAWINKYRK
jgi:hypothetical protein